jgi:hypothetical protein
MWEIAYGLSWMILRHAKFCIYGNHSLHQLKHTVAHPKKEMRGKKTKKSPT